MASIGQLLMAGQGAASREDIRLAEIKEKNRREKAGRFGGFGRTAGFLGGLLATASMTNPLMAAIYTGLGALGGRSVGRALGGGLESQADKSLDTDFYQGAQRDFKKDISNYQQGMRERMLMDTGKDVFSAYSLGKMKDAYLAKQKAAEQTAAATQQIAQNTGASASAVADPLDQTLLNLTKEEELLLNAPITEPYEDQVTSFLEDKTQGVLPAGGGNLGVTTQQYGAAGNVIDFNQDFKLSFDPNMQNNTNVIPTYIGGQYQGNQPTRLNPLTGQPW